MQSISIGRSLTIALFAFLLTWPVPAAAGQPGRPPAPRAQRDCLVWWKAPEHIGELVTTCGYPEAAVERAGVLVLQLGPTPDDLEVEVPLTLAGGCPASLGLLRDSPALTRVEATGALSASAAGPVLRVDSCDHLLVEPATARASVARFTWESIGPSPSSGIAGQVMLGPICPGPERPDRVCERPYEATIIVLDQQGRVLSQVRSNAAGQFRVPLTPGTYILRPETPGRLPRAAEQTVRVEAGQFTRVEIRYNTGIR